MIYYKEGTHQITEELTLANFHWEATFVGLNLRTGAPLAIVELWENHFTHTRHFTFPYPPSYDQTNLQAKCMEQLLTLPQFEGSTLVP